MEQRKNKPSLNKNIKQKKLPWWVELLFVQIGLPDRWLIKFLKTNKNLREVLNNEKKVFIAFIFFVITIYYFQPVINHSKSKLKCQTNVKEYIQSNDLISLDEKDIIMFAINYCNGGLLLEKLINKES